MLNYPLVGRTFYLVRPVVREPYFVAPEGRFGTINRVDPERGFISGRMHLDLADTTEEQSYTDELCNCIHWQDETLTEFIMDVILLPD